MRVLMPSRILDRPTGGNTTYARHIAAGLESNGIEVERIAAGNHPGSTMVIETLAGLRRGNAQDILHYVADTGPLVRTRRASVVTVHGVASRWIKQARTSRQESIWRTRVKRAIESTDRIITVSASSARDIESVFGVNADRITVIEHGVDVDRFSQRTTVSPELAAQLPSNYVLYLGNIEPRKNLVELVRAFDAPELRGLDIKLVVAGRPAWNSDEIVRQIDASDRAIRLGYVSDRDRVALMQSASLFAFPSLYEGFGFPVLEALAAGAVVLTSNRGSLAEVAGPALRFTSLEADGMVHDIAAALTETESRDGCRSAGLTWASRFTWDASVRQHVKLYEELIR